MKTLILAARKAKRSVVPITLFAFEDFEIPVRRASRSRPLQSKAAFSKVNSPHHTRLLKIIPRPIDAAQPAKIFLPAPSPERHGLVCLRLEAQPVVHAAAASSGHAGPRSFDDGCDPCDAVQFPHAFCEEE